MKAYDFEFAGQTLSSFGMVLCQFGGAKGLETIDGAEITFNTVSTLGGKKHNLTSNAYESCLETTLQICKYSCSTDIQEITDIELRHISRWLSQKKFLKLKFLDEDHINYYYEAAFTNISRIEIDGRLVGLELAVTTNRPFALKEQEIIVITCEGEDNELFCWEKYKTDPETISLGYVTSKDENAYPQGKLDDSGNIINGEHKDGYQYIPVGKVYRTSISDVSDEEGYIYPYMEITVGRDGDLFIHNSIENRKTYIGNCKVGEVITMDYPIVQSSLPSSSRNIQNNFNWTFFRLANTYNNSRNVLTISLPCSIKLKYSPIVKFGI